MFITFAHILAALGPAAIFQIMNAARPLPRYFFNTILPEMTKNNYYVDQGYMTIRATMAGLAAMDSPYPSGGAIDVATFLERTAKIAINVPMNEATIRELQRVVADRTAQNQDTNEYLQREVLNFLDKVILQAHLDTFEWLRGQALNKGKIDWQFNGQQLTVDYNIPAANFLTSRSGNDAYGGSTSKFWTDVKNARRKLRHNMRAIIGHPDLIDDIVYNEANKVEVIGQEGSTFRIRRLIGDNDRPATDARESVTLIGYDGEGEVLKPDGTTQLVPFQPRENLLFIAENNRSGYRVGEGSTDDPMAEKALGYTHLAPTVEGGGRPGRWADLFVPQDKPWQLVGRGVTNGLPVIENPDKIVVATSTVSA